MKFFMGNFINCHHRVGGGLNAFNKKDSRIRGNDRNLINKVSVIYMFLNLMLISSLAIAEDVAAPPALTPQQNYIFNITYEDAEAAISKALSEKAEDGKIVSATISGKKSAPLFSNNKPINVEVRGLRADSGKNNWSANLVILSEDAVISAMPLSGRYALMAEVPTLRNTIKNGQLITDEDIEIKQFGQERIHGDTVKNSADLIGKTAIRTISPARPIRVSEVSFPALIKKNAIVQMRYKTGNMEITTTGQALSDGAKGEVIEVKNTTSKKSTRAVVFDEHTVDVMSQGVPSNAK